MTKNVQKSKEPTEYLMLRSACISSVLKPMFKNGLRSYEGCTTGSTAGCSTVREAKWVVTDSVFFLRFSARSRRDGRIGRVANVFHSKELRQVVDLLFFSPTVSSVSSNENHILKQMARLRTAMCNSNRQNRNNFVSVFHDIDSQS